MSDWGLHEAAHGTLIRIRSDLSLAEEEYHLQVADSITLTASTPTGAVWGLNTLGQLLADGCRNQVQIQDQPDVPFRCLLVDVARRYHSLSTLRTLVRWCQAGRVRFMQLHLTDDQNWMFPTKVLAGIDKNNQHGLPAYTAKEMRDLQEFASARGVTIIPEIDVPGHSSLLVRLNPALYRFEGSESESCIDFASPGVRERIKSLLQEVARVFPGAPYVHLGGDEAWYPNAQRDPDMEAALVRLGPGTRPDSVFLDFLAEMAREVVRLGKTPIVWRGFQVGEEARKRLPPETVVVAWDGPYDATSQLTVKGFEVINAGWDPFYIVNHFPYDIDTLVPLERLYTATRTRFHLVDGGSTQQDAIELPLPEQVRGTLLCWWEGREWNAHTTLPARILAYGCRMWNAGGESEYDAFVSRMERVVSHVERQAHPFHMTTRGARLEDEAEFEDSLTISLTPFEPGVRFAWRTDGRTPTPSDLQDGFSFQVDKSAVLAIQAFRGTEPVGETLFRPVHKVTVVPNLALGRPLVATGARDLEFPAWRVNDGVADDPTAYWLAYPNPQFATIDLGRVVQLTRLEVVAAWASGQPARYRLTTSLDGNEWDVWADAREQTEPARPEGYVHRLPARRVRYVRIETAPSPLFPPTMARILEIRAFGDDGWSRQAARGQGDARARALPCGRGKPLRGKATRERAHSHAVAASRSGARRRASARTPMRVVPAGRTTGVLPCCSTS
ncbi:MAG: family 20 glycosylhydrolase [Fimbriimonadaceae bacterium]|nr:family 20 glycosylhydrolase [Fimbriimonadaceae bacterium]